MFKNRTDAGKQLAQYLLQYKNKKDVLVLGIPRGGVEVAYEVAKKLELPLDILVIKKIGSPDNEEFALGAAGVDSYYINEEYRAGISEEYIKDQIKRKQEEAKKRYTFLRQKKPLLSVKNKIVILIDDGVATGATMVLAVQVLKRQQIKKIIVAVPVAPPEAVQKLKEIADEIVCLSQPRLFMAIGQFYDEFPQVEEEKVKEYLEEF